MTRIYTMRSRERKRQRYVHQTPDLFEFADRQAAAGQHQLSPAAKLIASRYRLPPHLASLIAERAGFPVDGYGDA
jgi:hypothetical protein